MVILRTAPFHVSAETVIGGPMFQVRMDKYLQAICFIPEDIVCTASDDNTGAFFCQLLNNVILDGPKLILVGGTHRPVGKRSRQPASVSIFPLFSDISLRKPAFIDYLLDQLPIIAGNAFAINIWSTILYKAATTREMTQGMEYLRISLPIFSVSRKALDF